MALLAAKRDVNAANDVALVGCEDVVDSVTRVISGVLEAHVALGRDKYPEVTVT